MSKEGGRKSAVATRRGDDGTTGLLYGGDRVPKDDVRTEAAGTIDEAIATLGLARAELILEAQRGALPRIVDGLPDARIARRHVGKDRHAHGKEDGEEDLQQLR